MKACFHDEMSLFTTGSSLLGWSQSYMAKGSLSKEVVKQLMKLGADICHVDDSGKSVIDYYLIDNTPHLLEEGSEKHLKYREKLTSSVIYKYLKKLYVENCISV